MKPSPRYHFISGLPRSGSTLLSALLRQNPRFHASMSSPVGALVSANIKLMSSGSEVGLMVDAQQRRKILTGLFDSTMAIGRRKSSSTPIECGAPGCR